MTLEGEKWAWKLRDDGSVDVCGGAMEGGAFPPRWSVRCSMRPSKALCCRSVMGS
jgi:hypothetical protein